MVSGVLLLIAELIWFLPLFLRQGKKDAVSKKYTVFSIVTGMILGIIIASFGTGFFSGLLETIAPESQDTWVYRFFFNLLAAGVAEEITKFLIGVIFIAMAKPVRKLDYVFIMGGAGLGFAITENMMNSFIGKGSIWSAILPMHLMWQFYMGSHYYEAKQAKLSGDKGTHTKEMLLALGVPILIHGTYDFMVEIAQYAISLVSGSATTASDEKTATVLLILNVIWTLAMLAFVIVTEVRTAKLVKESRLADAQLTESTAVET